jgi:peptidoglycan-N-acetylglucosamine deacetylase
VAGPSGCFLGEAAELPPTAAPAPWFLQSSFSVSLVRASVVSVRFTLTSFTGGAHGAHWTEPLNMWTRPVRAFGVDELFRDPASGISGLSAYAITQLLVAVEGGQTRDESWVQRGAGAEAKNFTSFNLTSRGILLTFDEYQVGSYAEGASEVHVPYEVIRRQLIPTLAREVLGGDV